MMDFKQKRVVLQCDLGKWRSTFILLMLRLCNSRFFNCLSVDVFSSSLYNSITLIKFRLFHLFIGWLPIEHHQVIEQEGEWSRIGLFIKWSIGIEGNRRIRQGGASSSWTRGQPAVCMIVSYSLCIEYLLGLEDAPVLALHQMACVRMSERVNEWMSGFFVGWSVGWMDGGARAPIRVVLVAFLFRVAAVTEPERKQLSNRKDVKCAHLLCRLNRINVRWMGVRLSTGEVGRMLWGIYLIKQLMRLRNERGNSVTQCQRQIEIFLT